MKNYTEKVMSALIFDAFCAGFKANEFGGPALLNAGKVHAAAKAHVNEVLKNREEQNDD